MLQLLFLFVARKYRSALKKVGTSKEVLAFLKRGNGGETRGGDRCDSAGLGSFFGGHGS
jgi:hypothetical protein